MPTQEERVNLSILLASTIVMLNEVVEEINAEDIIKFGDKRKLMNLVNETKKFESNFRKAIIGKGKDEAELQFYRHTFAFENLIKVVKTMGALDVAVLIKVAEFIRDNDLNDNTKLDLNDVFITYQTDEILKALSKNLLRTTPEMLQKFEAKLGGYRHVRIEDLSLNYFEDYTKYRKRLCRHALCVSRNGDAEMLAVEELGIEQALELNNFLVKEIDKVILKEREEI